MRPARVVSTIMLIMSVLLVMAGTALAKGLPSRVVISGPGIESVLY